MSPTERPPISRRVALAGWTEHDYFGYRVFRELCGESSLAELLLMSLTGRRPSPQHVAMAQDLAGAFTLADPRVPPLKLARLVASFGDATAGTCAGVLSTSGARIGPAVSEPAAHLLLDARDALGRTPTPSATRTWLEARLAEASGLPGFGIPFRGADERVTVIRRQLERRGMADGTFVGLADALARAAADLRDLPCNVTLYTAAVGLDMGLVPAAIALLGACLSLHCFSSNAFEGAEQRDPALQRLPPDLVDYQGPPPRPWPGLEP